MKKERLLISLILISQVSTIVGAQSKSPPSKKGLLTPTVSDSPAAGVCQEASGRWVSAQITSITSKDSDGVPMPRCVQVTKRQRLKTINRAGGAIRVTLGPFTIRIRPGAEGIFNKPFGSYLATGVHVVRVSDGHAGPALWLQDKICRSDDQWPPSAAADAHTCPSRKSHPALK